MKSVRILLLAGTAVMLTAPVQARDTAFQELAAPKQIENNQAATGAGLDIRVSLPSNAEALPINRESIALVAIRNETVLPITITENRLVALTATKADFQIKEDSCRDKPLPGGNDCFVMVSITPHEGGAIQANLVTNHSGQNAQEITILSANAAGFKPADSDLKVDGEVKFTYPGERLVMVTNTLDRPINVTAITPVGAPGNNVRISWSDCPGFIEAPPLDVGQKCAITLVASEPLKKASADLLIEHTGPTRRFSVPIIFDPAEELLNANASTGPLKVTQTANGITIGQPGGELDPIAALIAQTNAQAGDLKDKLGGDGKKEQIEDPVSVSPEFNDVSLAAISVGRATLRLPEGPTPVEDGETIQIGETAWKVKVDAAKRVVTLTAKGKRPMRLQFKVIDTSDAATKAIPIPAAPVPVAPASPTNPAAN